MAGELRINGDAATATLPGSLLGKKVIERRVDYRPTAVDHCCRWGFARCSPSGCRPDSCAQRDRATPVRTCGPGTRGLLRRSGLVEAPPDAAGTAFFPARASPRRARDLSRGLRERSAV
ncbi:hypothetical protein GCM10027570_37470 [Streptomonospora sediminis]